MKDLTKLTSRQISQIKNIYKANSSIYSRIETLQKHLDKIQTELNEQLEIIDANEAGVKMLTGGFISKQLIKDEQIPQFNEDGTPKMDKDGKYQQKKRVLTFVVPVQEPTEEVGQEETTTDAGENDLKSEKEAFPDNLNDVENM
jgi:hypothetical protein|nr:MAG TPA: hypothetical protein [Crassvirales sp.]